MASKPPRDAPAISDRTIRQQLDRVLASATFHKVDRLKRFLRFVVTQAASGRREDLKEYVVGVQVFGKETSFDPRTDPIVRVQARRLRARLVRYYREEGQHDEIVIELPKGGYVPAFKRREVVGTPTRSLGATLVSRNTIAILAIGDYSPAGDLEYFCNGLTQEIVHRVSKLKGLRVLAAPASETAIPDPREIGRRFNAAMVLSGSVRRAGDRLRITTQLVDTASGCYIWSDVVDATVADPFAAQDEVAAAVARQLKAEVIDDGHARGRPVVNLAAHNLYLQGRYHLNQRTEEGLGKAVEFFEKAIVEDAHYALAHSGLSDAYALLGHYGVLGPSHVWTKAASSAATAVMLDASSAEAHTSLAHAKATQDWDWPGSEREFQSAISLNPRYATARHWYAMSCLVPLGRLDEALDEMLTAQSLDPVSSIIARDLAVIHLYRRDLEAALEQCDHTIELNPHFPPAYLTLGVVQERRGDVEESIAALQRAVHLWPESPRMQSALGRALAMADRRKDALQRLRALEEVAQNRYVSPFEFALMHVALNEAAAAFKWLAKACQDRCFELIAMKLDPRLQSVSEDRRFAAIARQLALREWSPRATSA